MSTKVAQPIIMWPHKAAEVLGQEGTQEVVDLINQALASVSATKVDKSDYDAHAALVKEQFERSRLETKKDISDAKSSLIKWMVALQLTTISALAAILISLLG